MLWMALCGIDRGAIAQDSDPPEALSGFSVSETYDLVANRALDLTESYLVRALYRIAKVSPKSLAEFSRDTRDVSWQQLLEKPREHRFHTFTREATLLRITLLRFSETASGGLKGAYLATCKSEDGTFFFLLCRSAPRQIPRDEPISEPIRFSGFFYNAVALTETTESNNDLDGLSVPELNIAPRADAPAGDTDDSNLDAAQGQRDTDGDGDVPSAALLIVNRLAWFPNSSHQKQNVSAGQIELAARGVDVGLFDYVKKLNGKPLSKQDANAFYQMLQAVSVSTDTPKAQRDANSNEPPQSSSTSSVEFIDLVKNPTKNIGQRVKMTGSLRQCVRVSVPNDAPQNTKEKGLSHYYQVSLFPNLDGRKIVTRGVGVDASTTESDDLKVSFDRYPVTLCVAKLPHGFSAKTLTGKMASVEGFYYRMIKYQSIKTENARLDGMLSPLVMASEINLISTAASKRSFNQLTTGFLWVMLLMVAAAIAWRLIQWRKTFANGQPPTRQSAFVLPETIDVSNFEDQNLDD